MLSERYVRKHLEPLGRDERANEEHREMLDVWLARDERKIAALAVVHIGKTLDDLRLQLNADDKTATGTGKQRVKQRGRNDGNNGADKADRAGGRCA